MLLEVENLSIEFETSAGTARAVDGVSFSIEEGKTHVLVGESGCGKSVSSLAIMGLLPGSARLGGGRILFDKTDITKYSRSQMRELRGAEMGMIFQEPMTALNPVMKAGAQIEEAVRQHPHRSLRSNMSPYQRTLELIEQMHLKNPEEIYRKYPHELSGGMRQRIMIAVALACRPRLLIADEPTTALDVTTQEQILSLINELQKEMGTSVLFITHNFGVVSQVGHSLSVLYAGQVVEEGSVRDVFKNPCHPYTKALFQAIPDLTTERQTHLKAILGNVPPATEYGKMSSPCRFYERCEFKDDRCFMKPGAPGHRSYCRRNPDL